MTTSTSVCMWIMYWLFYYPLFQLTGDWKNLRRAFRKLDKTNNGFLTVPEFRSVLKLANVILDEDEVYHVLNKFDHNMTGKIQYEKFIEETFKPESRHSVRPAWDITWIDCVIIDSIIIIIIHVLLYKYIECHFRD